MTLQISVKREHKKLIYKIAVLVMESEGKLECQSQRMQRHLLDVVDTDWRTEKLPFEDIKVPQELLPDPEADSTEEAQMTIKDLEQRWTDLGLSKFAETDSNKQ